MSETFRWEKRVRAEVRKQHLRRFANHSGPATRSRRTLHTSRTGSDVEPRSVAGEGVEGVEGVV
jgi:hypothetical protein